MAISANEAARRFSDAGFARSDRYQEGTEGKGSEWAASKQRAAANFTPAMQAALQEKRYEKGLEKADASDYDRGVRDKGVQNWSTGMSAAGPKYQERIQPFTGLWDQNLPTGRGPKRSASNIKRMTENVQRFIDAAGK